MLRFGSQPIVVFANIHINLNPFDNFICGQRGTNRCAHPCGSICDPVYRYVNLRYRESNLMHKTEYDCKLRYLRDITILNFNCLVHVEHNLCCLRLLYSFICIHFTNISFKVQKISVHIRVVKSATLLLAPEIAVTS